MKIIRADAMGMCFGVRDAIAAAQAVEDPASVTLLGPLVHNEQVMAGLRARGFAIQPDGDAPAVPATPRVMITAHGLCERERRRLAEAGKEIIDTTCPLVRRVHEAACTLEALGYFVVLIGKPGHVEVRGITGDLERYAIVARPEDVTRFGPRRLGVLCQTTTAPDQAQRVLLAIHQRNPGCEIRTVATICRPTLDRQAAVRSLLGQVEALVVAGGRNSNNTLELVRLAEDFGRPVRHVQRPEDVDEAWLEPFERVGLTAGTSTPGDLIEAVYRRLVEIARAQETRSHGEVA